MYFNVSTKIFAQACSMVQKAASSRDTVPVLSGMLIEARGTTITLEANDLEIAIRKTLSEVPIEREGRVLVNARYLTEIVRSLPEEDLTIEVDEEKKKLQIVYGRSSASLNIYDCNEFPEIPIKNKRKLFTAKEKIFKEGIRKTSIAAAVSHFKPVFTGIMFDLDSEKLRLVASDTHRLAVLTMPIDNKDAVVHGQFIVPARSLVEMSRFLDDDETPIDVYQSENNLVFENHDKGWLVLTRLIEGQYPNYHQVIPQEYVNDFTLRIENLAHALDRASLLPADPKSIKYVLLHFKEEELVIWGYSEKLGEMIEVIDGVQAAKNEELRIAFNTRYLSDVVKVLQSEADRIAFKVTGSMGPCLIKNPEDDDYHYVLVPVRTA